MRSQSTKGSLYSPLGLVLVAGSLLVPTAPIYAQQQADTIEEIIISARQRAYRGDFTLLETPQSIQVLGEALLSEAGVRDLSEALDLSATVTRQNNFGGLWNSFAVRGFAGDENLPSNVLVNGFNAGRGFGGPRDIAGIEAVEVLKGPSAALFGRGEPGGTVNLLTKRPTGISAGQLRMSADEFGSLRTDVDYSSNVIGQGNAFRLVGYAEDGKSFRDTVNYKRYGILPSAFVRLGEHTTVVYELEASSNKVPFDRGVVAIDGDPAALPARRFLGEPGDGPMTADALGHQLELNYDINDNWRFLTGLNYRETSLKGFSSEPEFFGGRQQLTRDGRNLTRQRRYRDYDAEYMVLRAEINGNVTLGNTTHRIIFGFDTDRFENDQVFRRYRAPVIGPDTTLQDSYAIDVFNPVYGQFPLPTTSPLTDRVDLLKATGIYLQDQFNLGERLQLRLGLRYDDFSQRSNNRLATHITRQNDKRISPQLGVVYSMTDDLSIYGSYGEGFRANPGADAGGAAFDPNQSNALEAGIKFELWNGDLQGNLALFRLEQENMLAADSANPGFNVAIGKARSQGLDFDLAARFDDYTAHFSYAYVDATSRRDVLDYNFWLQIQRGDQLINVPRHSISTQLSRELTLAGRPMTVGGGLLHVSKRRGETAFDFNLPAYTLLRLHAGFNVSDSVMIRAELDNALNEQYFPNSFARVWVQPGMPRRARLSAEIRF